MKLKSILLIAAGMLSFGNSFAQSLVSTGGKKYTLIEEATGNWCGYCVDGAQVIEQSIEPDFKHAVVASWHGYAATNDAMIVAGDPIDGTGWISGFPDGLVNRDAVTFGGIEQDRGKWIHDCTVDSATSPNFDVTMDSWYDNVKDTIHITITAIARVALTGQYNINGLILEDSIPSGSTDPYYMQHSYFYDGGTAANGQPTWWTGLCNGTCYTSCSTCAYLPAADYFHMNVVRALLAKGAKPSGVMDQFWGDTAMIGTITVGQTASKTYTYHIPSTSNATFIKVVGLVSKMGTATTDRAVQNTVNARVRLMKNSIAVLGVVNNNPPSSFEDVSIYPNPASNSINVKCTLNAPSETRITITNMIGQVVFEKTYDANGTSFTKNIELNNFNNGIYTMSISNHGLTNTQKFTINK